MIFKPVLPVYVLVFVAIAFIAYIVFVFSSKKQRNIPIRRILMLFLMFAILLRPMIRGGITVRQESSTNIFFALDLSNSMVVNDSKDGQYRYEKARADIQEIAKSFPGARYSVIALDYATHIAVPLSDNIDAILSYASEIHPTDNELSKGSNLSELIVYTMKHIEKYREAYPERKNILFVMSDGEKTTNTDPVITANQKNALSAVRILGYGTKEGGFVKAIRSGEMYGATNHISALNETSLQSFAEDLGGKYINMNTSSFDQSKVAELTTTLELSDSGTIESYRDIYWILALLLAGILLWEFSDVLNKILDERKVIKK